MIELMTLARKLRPDFQLLAGNELMVSAAAIGATGLVAPLACVAPTLIRRLYDACRAGKLFEARAAQEEVASLRQAMKPGGAPHLKAALRAHGSRLRRSAPAAAGAGCRRREGVGECARRHARR